MLLILRVLMVGLLSQCSDWTNGVLGFRSRQDQISFSSPQHSGRLRRHTSSYPVGAWGYFLGVTYPDVQVAILLYPVRKWRIHGAVPPLSISRMMWCLIRQTKTLPFIPNKGTHCCCPCHRFNNTSVKTRHRTRSFPSFVHLRFAMIHLTVIPSYRLLLSLPTIAQLFYILHSI